MRNSVVLVMLLSVLMLSSCNAVDQTNSQSLLDDANSINDSTFDSTSSTNSDSNEELYYVGMLPINLVFDGVEFIQYGIFDTLSNPLLELLGYLVPAKDLGKYDDNFIYCPIDFESAFEDKLPVYSIEGFGKHEAIAVKAFLTDILFINSKEEF